MQNIAYTQTYASSFVAVSGTDAFTRGTNLVLAFGSLVGTVEHAVRGQNQVSTTADVQTFGEFVTGSFQFVSLSHKEVGSNDATITNDIDFTLVENARGDGTEYELLSVENDGVSGIRSTGKTCHHVVTRCKVIYYFSFALISENDTKQGINFSFCHNYISMC